MLTKKTKNGVFSFCCFVVVVVVVVFFFFLVFVKNHFLGFLALFGQKF